MSQFVDEHARRQSLSPTAECVVPRAGQGAPAANTRLSNRARTKLPVEIVELREASKKQPPTTEVRAPVSVGQPSAPLEIEEFFTAVVEEITDDAVRLRTRSSEGEEAIAWLKLDRIPESERRYVELGAPMRITILVTKGPQRRRETEIRFLRPSQWYRPSKEEAEPVTKVLLERMREVLNPDR